MYWFTVFLIGLGPAVLVTGALLILEDPSSLLLPIPREATLTCRALCVAGHTCTGYWLINGSYSHTQISHRPKAELLMKGFVFPDIRRNGSEYTLTLRVNASAAIDNTNIQCEFDVSGSSERNWTTTAKILVITNSPLSVNPAIEINDTQLTLLWSPPFLWPGQPIHYFSLSVINNTDAITSLYRINTTFSDRIVIFALKLDQGQIQDILTCTKMTFTISAFAASDVSLPQSFSLSKWILPPASTIIEVISSAIQTDVYYRVDKTPALIEVTLQAGGLKLSCTFTSGSQAQGCFLTVCRLAEFESNGTCHELNYTLIFENREGELLKQVGPFQYYFADSAVGSVTQLIMADHLEKNETYTLRVQVTIVSETFTSHEHRFNTSFRSCVAPTYCDNNTTAKVDQWGVFPCQIGFGITSFALAVLMSVVMSTVFLIICKRVKNVLKTKRLQRRICNNNVMIPNPIYDGETDQNGPVYEVVHQPQCQRLQKKGATTAQYATCGEGLVVVDNDQGGGDLDTETNVTSDVNAVRYADHPVKLSLADKSQSYQSVPVSGEKCTTAKSNGGNKLCQDENTLKTTSSDSVENALRDLQSTVGAQKVEKTKGDEQYILMKPVVAYSSP